MAAKRPKLRDRVIDFRRVKARDLVPHPHNWRLHPKAQSAALKGILDEVGVAGALLAYERDGKLTVIDGHLRKDTAPDHEWPVVVLDVTDAEADYLLATHDPLAAMAQPDQDKLLDLLASVETNSQAVKDMLEALANGETQPLPPLFEDVEPRIDEADELREKWGVERGQIWTLGEHRLMCGDSESPKDSGRLAFGEMADCMWTDPPYGVEYVGKTADKLTIANDEAAGLRERLTATFTSVKLKPSSPVYIAAPPGPQWVAIWSAAFIDAGWRFHQGLVWIKDSMVLGHSDYHYRHENILYGWTQGSGRPGRGRHNGTRWSGGHDAVSVPEVPRPKRSEEHPTMKPVGLVEACLRNSTQQGQVVLDPFVGSGTTIIAAERIRRRCFAMEIAPGYVAVSLQRWADATGKTPVLDG